MTYICTLVLSGEFQIEITSKDILRGGVRRGGAVRRDTTLSNIEITQKIHCGVEQLAARRAHNPKVARSSRVPATRKSQSNLTGFLHFRKR